MPVIMRFPRISQLCSLQCYDVITFFYFLILTSRTENNRKHRKSISLVSFIIQVVNYSPLMPQTINYCSELHTFCELPRQLNSFDERVGKARNYCFGTFSVINLLRASVGRFLKNFIHLQRKRNRIPAFHINGSPSSFNPHVSDDCRTTLGSIRPVLCISFTTDFF